MALLSTIGLNSADSLKFCKPMSINLVFKEKTNSVSTLQLYSSAISEHPTEDIPSYWHKNYALVCQQLLSLQHSLSREVLVDKAIFHYETFIKEDPTDENYDAIVKIVQQLKTQREHNGR